MITRCLATGANHLRRHPGLITEKGGKETHKKYHKQYYKKYNEKSQKYHEKYCKKYFNKYNNQYCNNKKHQDIYITQKWEKRNMNMNIIYQSKEYNSFSFYLENKISIVDKIQIFSKIQGAHKEFMIVPRLLEMHRALQRDRGFSTR